MEQPLASLSSFVGYFRRSRAEVSAGSFKLLFAALVIASAFCAAYVDPRAVFSALDVKGAAALGVVVDGCCRYGGAYARASTAAILSFDSSSRLRTIIASRSAVSR